ncbi:hypothetical protein PVAP13_8KG094800 [Panicum virgatum]|uniref:Uncharacterized protein n=1 Tax=Panicum virgatum TaxID=38727 RepID=A0A8T0PFN9_PANVG|nr:hypothetical protein PVAP13_8KG094800 [Panicum virgatum]
MTSCQACGATAAGGEAPARDNAKEAFEELQKRIAQRIAKFVGRAVLLLLLLYLYDSMRRYVTSSIDEDLWFCKFVVITVAVPMADVFIILASLLLD